MANDLKLGTLDVANLKLGSSQVSKVMLGTTQVWAPAPAGFAPTLTDFFTDVYVVSIGTKLFTVQPGKTIPVGALLVVAATVNGTYLTPTMADNATVTGAPANAYTLLSDSTWVQAANCFGALFLCKVTRQLDAGKVITLTHTGASRNRGAAVVAWFADAAHFPDLTPSGSVVVNSGSGSTWNVGPQSVAASAPTLDLAMPFSTGAPPPWGYTSGFTKIADSTTTTGSADRGVSLGYKISPAAGARSASGTLTSAVWAAGLAAPDYTP